jgi:hypothetical protein
VQTKVQTKDNNPIDWELVRKDYETKGMSDRALAKEVGVSDTALRKRAKKHGWAKLADCTPEFEPKRKPDPNPHQPRLQRITRAVGAAPTGELTARGRNLILALMEELEFLNQHAEILSELVEDHFSGEKDTNARFKLQKALDHAERTKSCNQLATALAKLNDAAPGKKEQASTAAETAGQDGGWGDDLDAAAPTKFN